MYSKMYNLPQGAVSLKQGKKFNDFQNDHLHIVGSKRLNLIEETTSPNLGFLEAMSNNTSNSKSNPINVENSKIGDTLSNLENEFNTTLTTYTNLYKLYLEKTMNEKEFENSYATSYIMGDKPSNFTFFGHAVGPTGKSKIPVQQIVMEGPLIVFMIQDGKDTKIVKSPPNLSKQAGFYYVGNINDYGKIPLIPNGVSTPDKPGRYNVKKNGMSANDARLMKEANESLTNALNSANQKLLDIANQMYQESVKIEQTHDKVHGNINATSSDLLDKIKALNKEREQINKLNTSTTTLDADISDSLTDVNMEKTKYIGLGVVALILGGVTIHLATK